MPNPIAAMLAQMAGSVNTEMPPEQQLQELMRSGGGMVQKPRMPYGQDPSVPGGDRRPMTQEMYGAPNSYVGHGFMPVPQDYDQAVEERLRNRQSASYGGDGSLAREDALNRRIDRGPNSGDPIRDQTEAELEGVSNEMGGQYQEIVVPDGNHVRGGPMQVPTDPRMIMQEARNNTHEDGYGGDLSFMKETAYFMALREAYYNGEVDGRELLEFIEQNRFDTDEAYDLHHDLTRDNRNRE